MRGLSLYIMREMLAPISFIALALTGVAWLTQSLRFVDEVVRGMPATSFLKITMLLLPSVLGMTLVLALFFGTIYAFHRLYAESELLVMWACGWSTGGLGRPALTLAALFCLVLYGLGLWLSPWGLRSVKDLQHEFQGSFLSVALQEGRFNSVGDGLTVYVRERLANGELAGLLVHDQSDPESPVTFMAERGALVDTKDGPRLLLVKGNRQVFGSDGRTPQFLFFDRNLVDISDRSEESDDLWFGAKERYLGELFAAPDGDRDLRKQGRLIAEGHHRLAFPLYALTLTLIAMTGVLSGEYDRRRRAWRLIVTGACGVGVLLAAMGFTYLAASDARAIPLIYANVAIPALVAAWLMRRNYLRRHASADLAAGLAR
ncbi:LptF/LptG family permease [Oceanibacterium hippocampi]|uniref:Lipopolysaccharide export system permease protein LptF n=1 Tax=Oceanibacterium hippocampi TaxID=745714 RepID=A0A1Y5SWS8_9PROT|nr:LptF/LptG family permease [Oceanibacterium hippocampi]SLN48352.1 Lipopolysaccharide export system permease protein LptF [Oceanibacterium hippocampi]